MKNFILCLIVALLCVTTLAFALPTPNHIMLDDGHRLTFGHDECRKALKVIIQQQIEEQLRKQQQQSAATYEPAHPVVDGDDDAHAAETTAETTTTTPATTTTPHLLNEDMPLFTFLDALTWINITDIVVKDDDWSVRECTIYRDIHGWRIDANGVCVKATASWSYAFEQNAPAITDQGKVDVIIDNANVDAIILAHGDDDDDSSDDDNQTEEENATNNNNEDNVINNLEEFHQYLQKVDHYTAHVVTFIHNMTLKFRETDYADFYDKMAAEHNEAMKWVVSLGANIYLSAALTHYLNPDVVQFQNELQQFVLKNQHVEHEKDLSSTTLTTPYHPQHEDRMIELGMMLNSLVPTEVESPEDILRLAHGGGDHYYDDEHNNNNNNDDDQEKNEHEQEEEEHEQHGDVTEHAPEEEEEEAPSHENTTTTAPTAPASTPHPTPA